MKPRKSKRPGYTPSFPALRDELIAPVSVKGEAPAATGFPGSFLSGFACAVNERPDAGSEEWQKLYDAYLASPRWKEKRAPIIDRASGHCERCGRACAALEVHHLTYERFGGNERPEDLQALCRGCHDQADDERKAAWKKQLAKWAAEAEDERHEARFAAWMRACHGENYYDDLGSAGVAEEREKWDERQHDREGDDYE